MAELKGRLEPAQISKNNPVLCLLALKSFAHANWLDSKPKMGYCRLQNLVGNYALALHLGLVIYMMFLLLVIRLNSDGASLDYHALTAD